MLDQRKRFLQIAIRSFLTIVVVMPLALFVGCANQNNNSPVSPEIPYENNTKWQVDSVSIPGFQIAIISGFESPFGLKVAPDGTVYVPDTRGGQLVRFTPDLRPNGWLGMLDGESSSINGWHYEGEPRRCQEYGAFDMAHSLDIDQYGNLYIPDYAAGKIQRYAPDGTLLGIFYDNPASPDLAFNGSVTGYFDADYNYWVSDFNLHRITKFDPTGKLIGWMGERTGGELTGGFTVLGTSQHSTSLYGFNQPQEVKFDRFGNFYVVEIGNHRIQKFAPNGQLLGWLGAYRDGTLTDGWATEELAGETSVPGGFRNPVSIHFLDNDDFIVCDNGNDRIQKFTYDGKFVGWIGGKAEGGVTNGWETTGLSAGGIEPGMMRSPYEAVIHNDKLYVADGHNGRVQIFTIL
ncbi:MAG: hypothetical protein DRP45_06930 [Candidatus Zixiibacteriota bacterium]|nr:MAG: hypothetical protein DRP45_06930 [candidate division Zixibacteria bacterium]